ncbi:uncharacterized protein BDW43DRAFT_257990 [Aspergillus alliaceus]|uniref:uncharacterized protein n=1 Tax=Petromyces alliaceus TaxID=209559 RepID=UPI0012A565AD|nr:AKAP7 2'5' RNA ligase-like domain-containing protein [Aspergillus alliaceus]KAB8239415.1 AKAP7 2'5' RNA ligase-like domain-containing protein [Aspergillus alliaceus]
MIYPRPSRPLTTSVTLRLIFCRSYHPNHLKRMPDQQKKEKRPPLTHFLCLPLVNPVSLPQLESSLATFKASIPRHAPRYGAPKQPLIPDSALRPVGTLHLTLGVMSLPTNERLNEAIKFFQSLDLTSIAREAEDIANARARGKQRNAPSAPAVQQSPRPGTRDVVNGDLSHERPSPNSQADPITLVKDAPSPFTISLESLHALPRASAATVLYAAPVDPTARLYPFCKILRGKFLESGFLQGEQKKEPSHENGANVPSNGSTQAAGQSIPSKLKIRPLLLHATVANTIYVRGRPRGEGSQRGRDRGNTRFTFDARDIISHYRDYYVDSGRETPRSAVVSVSRGDIEQAHEDLSENEDSRSASEGNPFVWAKDFRIETVCICEMGAKKLDPEGDSNGVNSRLQEQYFSVVERSLDFKSSS